MIFSMSADERDLYSDVNRSPSLDAPEYSSDPQVSMENIPMRPLTMGNARSPSGSTTRKRGPFVYRE